MKNTSYIIFIMLLTILVFPNLIVDVLGYSSSEKPEFRVWPPIGTSATYVCIGWQPTLTLITLAGGLNPSVGKGEFREVYDDVKSYVLRVNGYPSRPPHLPEPLWIADLLEEHGVSFGCLFKWEIKNSNGTHYWIDVELILTLVRDPIKAESVDEIVSYLEDPLYAAKPLKHNILVDFERKIYVNGNFKGIWSLFLFPWELAEGSRIRLSAGNYWQLDPIGYVILSRERALNAMEIYRSSNEPFYNVIAYYVDKLGIPPERLLGAMGGVMIFNSSVTREEIMLEIEENKRVLGKIYDLKLTNISLEEFFKMNGLEVKEGIKYLVMTTHNLYDLDTGILVLHRDLQYQLDTLVRVIGILGRPLKTSVIDPGPEFILLTSYKLGEEVTEYEKPNNSAIVEGSTSGYSVNETEPTPTVTSTINRDDLETSIDAGESLEISNLTTSRKPNETTRGISEDQYMKASSATASYIDVGTEDRLNSRDDRRRLTSIMTTNLSKQHGVLTGVEVAAIVTVILTVVILVFLRVKGRGS